MASTRIARLVSLFALATTAWCAAQQAQNQPLQFTIRQTSPNYILQAEMHNAGKGPLTLSFGMQYARMAVDAIRLSLTDARGKVTTLTVRHYITTDPNFRDEHGSLGTVTLQPGESYSFPIDLRYYKDELGLPIATDHYTLQATFTEPVRNDKSVVLPEPRMPLWTGSVTAPPLPVTVTEDSIQ